MSNTVAEVCENCGRSVGKLEKIYLWEDHPVCSDCYARLRSDADAGKAPPVFEAIPSTPLPLTPGQVACQNPNCGFSGIPKERFRGSATLLVLLFLCGVIPGLIYAVICCGTEYGCPSCGTILKLSQQARTEIARAKRLRLK